MFRAKLLRIICLLLGFCIIATQYKQNDYKVIHYFAKVVYFNKDYVSSAKVYNVKPNRTYRAFRAYHCQLVDLDGSSFKVNVHGYTAKPDLKDTPMQFDVKVCDAMDKNLFGVQSVFGYSNYTKCPLKKGCYFMNDFVLTESQFPPFLPPSVYVFKFKIFYEGILLGEVEWHGEILKTL